MVPIFRELLSRFQRRGSQTTWQKNHGDFLIFFVGLILVAGSSILGYLQLQFRPPAFPRSEAIVPPAEDGLEFTFSGDRNADASTQEVNLDGAPVPNEIIAATGPDSPDTVQIKVVNVANAGGRVRIAIYDSAESFNDVARAIRVGRVGIEEGEASWHIRRDGLADRIAVAAYHDENQDGILNRSAFGIPSERYGFSRDARGRIGPPTFDAAVIDLPESGETITISIR